MSSRKLSKPSDPKLPVGGSRRRQGTVERHAAADLKALAALGALPVASEAIRSAYRLAGRQLDLAVRGEKTWDVVAASKELRSIRAQLLAEGGVIVADEELDKFLASLPATPRGYDTESGR